MAKKKAAKKATVLPKGFTAISGFGQSWPNEQTKVGDMLVGTVNEYDEIDVMRNKKKVKTQNLKLETDEGKIYTLWESAGLKPLFAEDLTDYRIAVIYEGLGKKKAGQNPPKLFQVGIEDED